MEKVTKTFDGKKYYYKYGDKTVRNSKHDYKYACVARSRQTGNSWVLSLGNNKQTTYNSMARFYAHYCDLVIVDIC